MESSTTNYINRLAEIYSDIVVDDGTLESKEMIHKFQRSTSDPNLGGVYIFQMKLGSKFLESRLNSRSYTIMTRIMINADKREELAQAEMNYFTEQIIAKLENAMVDVTWGDGYLDADNIASTFRENQGYFFITDIPIVITKRVAVSK